MSRNGRPIRSCLRALLPALVLLGGCGDEMRKSFGLGKSAPDEFQVVRRAPLSLPPDFSLRPPQPGATRPQEVSATDQARSSILGQASAAPPVDPAAPSASPRSPVAAGTLGGAAPASPPASLQAAVVRPAPATDPAGPSQAELVLLRQAGADKSVPNIRSVINEDLTKLASADSRFIDKLLVWRKNEAPASVLDARKENQRLQENAALGKPATEGDTPTIKRKNKGIFDGLF
ncbi:MAG: DUF3035 domain-containing protein [Alphaproteobacteria bacterium]|nr:DUF3035 domain-containing protein [Alphaproteobacteria bacterium]